MLPGATIMMSASIVFASFIFVGGTWAINKRLAYRQELLANRDYIRVVKKLEKEREQGHKTTAPPFDTATRYHDFLTGRNRRRLWASALHEIGVVN